jgi:uncharacterized membrane protein YqjE
MTMPHDISEPVPTGELMKRVVQEARELVKLEVELAKAELKEHVARTKRAAVAGGLAVLCLFLCTSALVVALVLALGGTVEVALLVALGLVLVGGILGWAAYALVPKSLLDRTRAHAKNDVNEFKEHAT